LNKLLENFNLDNQTLINDWRNSNEESIKLIREETTRRIEELRNFMKIMEEKVLRRVEIDKFEDFKKFIGNRVDTDAMKVKDLAKKVDPYDKKFEAIIADIDLKFKELNFKFNNFESKLDRELKELEARAATAKSSGNNFSNDSELMIFLKKQFACEAHQPFSEGSQVMERLLKLEEDNVKINNDHVKLNALILSLQTDVANKIDLATFSMQIGRKIDRDEMLDMLKSLTMDEEKTKKMQADISKLKKKLKETIDFVDEKIKELKKDFDVGYIQKMIKSKAEEKDVKGQFKSTQDTLAEHKTLFDHLKKDLDNLIAAYKKLSAFIALLQDEDASTLASTKHLCLSCGRGSKFAPELKQAQGMDGNMYFVDPRESSLERKSNKYDKAAEVFNTQHGVVCHNLILHHEHNSVNPGPKRPQTAGGNKSTLSVRPLSSSRFLSNYRRTCARR